MKPAKPPVEDRLLLNRIMLAILVWGVLLALGALLFGPDERGQIALAPNVWRGLIVLTCVAIFLGGWALLLRRSRSA